MLCNCCSELPERHEGWKLISNLASHLQILVLQCLLLGCFLKSLFPCCFLPVAETEKEGIRLAINFWVCECLCELLLLLCLLQHLCACFWGKPAQTTLEKTY